MTLETRAEAAAALVRLAASTDYRDRADAGQSLTRFLDVDGTRDVLTALLLDKDDTFVTLATTQALLRRDDSAGLDIVAIAWSSADCNHLDYLAQAVHEVLGIYAKDRDRAAAACAVLASSDDERVRRGATQLAIELAAINPVLGNVSETDRARTA